MKLLASLVVLAALVAPAAANPRKVVVMPSDGRADAKLRLKVDAAVLRLARTLPGDTVTPGEVSMVDLAAALGCNPDETACKDEVLTTLAVDEVVAVTVSPKLQGQEVVVRRITRGGATKEARTVVTSDKPEAVDGLAPAFGGSATAPTGPTPPPSGPTPPPTISTDPPPSYDNPMPPNPNPPPTTTEPVITDKRNAIVDGPRDTRGSTKFYKIGMGVGGGLLLIGLLSWASAADLGDQIQALPVKNKGDVAQLKDLETRADNAANAGNVFVIGGLIVGGVSTYYYLKHKKARGSQARVVPMVTPNGAGLALSFGAP